MEQAHHLTFPKKKALTTLVFHLNSDDFTTEHIIKVSALIKKRGKDLV